MSCSVAATVLTAVPGGVWASFRTGMVGQSVLLSQRGLAVIARAPVNPQLGPYEWPMSSSAVYGGGSLWWRLNPADGLRTATGAIRAQETVTSSAAQVWDLPAADPGPRLLYGLTQGSEALVAITPPTWCWTSSR